MRTTHKITNVATGDWFSIYAEPTVMEVLAFRESIQRRGNVYANAWSAAAALIDEWHVEAMPDYRTVNLQTTAGAFGVANIIMWVVNQITNYLHELEHGPPDGDEAKN